MHINTNPIPNTTICQVAVPDSQGLNSVSLAQNQDVHRSVSFWKCDEPVLISRDSFLVVEGDQAFSTFQTISTASSFFSILRHLSDCGPPAPSQ